jgi:hypothetical protein
MSAVTYKGFSGSVRVTPRRASDTGTAHTIYLVVNTNVMAGSNFRLWVNGKVTADIPFSTTAATFRSSVISALNTATGLTWTGSGTTAYRSTFTCTTANRFFRIEVQTQFPEGNAYLSIANAGRETITLQARLLSLSMKTDIEYTDVTPILTQYERNVVTKYTGVVEVSLYQVTNDNLAYILYEGNEVLVEIIDGTTPNSTQQSFYAIVQNVSTEYQNVKNDYAFTLRRNGAPVTYEGTLS